ncbi:MAG: hypothetical protein ABL949_14915 [Fimbriimonadaceae bacterium]
MPDPTTHREAIGQFAASVPKVPETIEESARNALRYVLAEPSASANNVHTDPSCCPNCGAHFSSTRSPYCSPYCREVSAFVRQFRNSLAEGSILREDRQVALGQKLWHLAGGGYPLRISLISEKDKLKIIATKGGLCELCEAPAIALDNVGSG